MMSMSLLFTVLATTSATSHAGERTLGIGFSSGYLVAERTDVIGNAVLLNPRVSYWPDENIGIELDVTLMPFDETSEGVPETFPFTGIIPAANLVGRVLKEQPVNLIFNVGAGPFIKSIQDDGALRLPYENLDIDFAAIAGPGFLVPLGPLAIRGDARWLVSIGGDNFENRGTSFSHAQFNLGVMWLPIGPFDEDKDGINDDDDSCLSQAEDIDGFQDSDGCPEPDNDEDSILDELDGCPDEAEDLDGFEDDNGCPDTDNDEDGLLDEDDRCPDTAGPEATEGCPDADGDLFADIDDECDFAPAALYPAPEPEEGQLQEDDTYNPFGCPDSDSDLVPDYRDECPDQRAPKGIDARRASGCVQRAYIGLNSIITVPGVSFDSRQRLRRTSKLTLDDAAKILARLDGVKKLEVQTHTSSVGDDEQNLKDSQENADTIVAYLVGKGVEPARLDAVGYGETKPIVEGDTEEARRKNSRIIFAIVEQVDPVNEMPAPGEDEEGDDTDDEVAPE
ncbi:MAG: OmpA family protein [Myxococcota bacterium]